MLNFYSYVCREERKKQKTHHILRERKLNSLLESESHQCALLHPSLCPLLYSHTQSSRHSSWAKACSSSSHLYTLCSTWAHMHKNTSKHEHTHTHTHETHDVGGMEVSMMSQSVKGCGHCSHLLRPPPARGSWGSYDGPGEGTAAVWSIP